MKITNRRIPGFILLAIFYGAASVPAQAGPLFRWYDDKGDVHYSDSVPPSASQSGHAELDKSGVTLKKVPAAKTDEQVKEERWLEDLETKRRKSRDKQMQEDNQLLTSYSDIEQFDSAHIARIGMVRDSRKQLELLREKLVTEISKLQDQYNSSDNAQHKERLQGFLESKRKSLADYDEAISQNREEEHSMELAYEKLRVRFLDLLKRKKEEAEAEKLEKTGKASTQ